MSVLKPPSVFNPTKIAATFLTLAPLAFFTLYLTPHSSSTHTLALNVLLSSITMVGSCSLYLSIFAAPKHQLSDAGLVTPPSQSSPPSPSPSYPPASLPAYSQLPQAPCSPLRFSPAPQAQSPVIKTEQIFNLQEVIATLIEGYLFFRDDLIRLNYFIQSIQDEVLDKIPDKEAEDVVRDFLEEIDKFRQRTFDTQKELKSLIGLLFNKTEEIFGKPETVGLTLEECQKCIPTLRGKNSDQAKIVSAVVHRAEHLLCNVKGLDLIRLGRTFRSHGEPLTDALLYACYITQFLSEQPTLQLLYDQLTNSKKFKLANITYHRSKEYERYYGIQLKEMHHNNSDDRMIISR